MEQLQIKIKEYPSKVIEYVCVVKDGRQPVGRPARFDTPAEALQWAAKRLGVSWVAEEKAKKEAEAAATEATATNRILLDEE